MVNATLTQPLTCIAEGFSSSPLFPVGNNSVIGVYGGGYRSKDCGGGSNGSLVIAAHATSLYVLPSFFASTLVNTTRHPSPALLSTDAELSPRVVSQLAGTTQWISGEKNPVFVQAVDVLSPGATSTLLDSNSLLGLRLASTGGLAYLSGFALIPSYRRSSSPLSHYGCPSAAAAPTFSASSSATSVTLSRMKNDHKGDSFVSTDTLDMLACGVVNVTSGGAAPSTFAASVNALGQFSGLCGTTLDYSVTDHFLAATPLSIGGFVAVAALLVACYHSSRLLPFHLIRWRCGRLDASR